MRYKEGAQTDLEGLRAFDSNQDGLFDAADENKWKAAAMRYGIDISTFGDVVGYA